jgi:murein DD-endopeptidase MepM/ murein hydrolase activator NlpD
MDEHKWGILVKSAPQNTFAQKAASLAHAAAGSDAAQRKRAAQEFASFLYLEVLKALRATLPKDGLFENDSLSMDVYSSMFDAEIARVLAQRDNEGFTRTVERALEKIVPKADAEAAGHVPLASAEAAARAPLAGAISSAFGMRDDPISSKKKFHAGLDIAAPAGAEIKAALGGIVTFSGTATGYGKMVEIDHGGGMVTRYAHNAANFVTAGQEIRRGDVIAIVGRTGRATGAHLHFEVRRDGKPVDPAPLLSGRGTKLDAMA